MKKDNKVQLLVIDLFCGAGGTTTGFVKVSGGAVKVIACVNHDPKAIKSHWMNHKRVKHFEEDIRILDLTELSALTLKYRMMYPSAKVILWASLECTNFSKAKGGLPREADSRTLADHLDRYVVALNPDYVQIENVVEFMSWGPLDENGKPLSKRSGCDWVKWKQRLCALGYYDDWKELNAADYGAYTSRNRLFGVFAKHHLPIAWPVPTHAKKPAKVSDMFGKPLRKWKAVRHVLDLETKGASIFMRKKPLSPKTMQRIYAGLVKFVAGGKENFMAKTYAVASNSDGVYSTDKPAHTITTRDAQQIVQPEFMLNYQHSSKTNDLDNPCPTLTTKDRYAIVESEFISKYFSGKPEHKNISINGPAGAIKTKDSQALVQVEFLAHYYGNGFATSLDVPCPTIRTKDGVTIVQPQYIMRDFQTTSNTSIEEPARTLLPVPKQHLVSVQPFIVNQNFNNGPVSIEDPSQTITANRKYPYLVNIDAGLVGIVMYEDDCEYTIKIKHFMALYGIMDIKMRMLMIPELLRIQGFPKHYKLFGNQGDQKKFIGNSVVPHAVTAWAVSLINKLKESSENHLSA